MTYLNLYSLLQYTFLAIGCFLITSCFEQTSDLENRDTRLNHIGNNKIPSVSDWTDLGTIIKPGPAGAWDNHLDGMISPSTAIKKDGIYYLYYIGADGNRSTDGGPRHRALGVATSTDGTHFIKYSGNPIITFLPHNNEEEGIFSAGATVDDNGDIVLYYSACDAGSATSENVNCDGRLAVSLNGFDFVDKGVVLSHKDSSVWGYGDELFPIGALHTNGQWYVYYIAKGSGINTGIRGLWIKFKRYLELDSNSAHWDMGIAWGTDRGTLANTKAILTEGSYIIGGGDLVQLASGKIAQLIVRDFKDTIIEVRIISTKKPLELSTPVVTYNFNDLSHATILFDEASGLWFLYYLNAAGNAIKLMSYSTIDIDHL